MYISNILKRSIIGRCFSVATSGAVTNHGLNHDPSFFGFWAWISFDGGRAKVFFNVLDWKSESEHGALSGFAQSNGMNCRVNASLFQPCTKYSKQKNSREVFCNHLSESGTRTVRFAVGPAVIMAENKLRWSLVRSFDQREDIEDLQNALESKSEISCTLNDCSQTGVSYNLVFDEPPCENDLLYLRIRLS